MNPSHRKKLRRKLLGLQVKIDFLYQEEINLRGKDVEAEVTRIIRERHELERLLDKLGGQFPRNLDQEQASG